MDDISRKLKAFDWKGLQKQAKKVQASTASALKDLVMTDLENKVRAATGDTNWGASGADLAEIAQGTYNREDFTLIMSILWQRLASTRWRCVYKALDVLRYLVLHGSSRVLEETRDALPHIRRLEHYSFVDQSTRRDEGANVRARASSFVAILADDRLLEEERTKSAALRAKIGIAVPSSHYTSSAGAGGGLSSDDYRFGAASHASHTSGGDAYDAPPQRSLGTAAAQFDGFGTHPHAHAEPQVTEPQATIDDLLGGPVPALPAPDSTPLGAGAGSAPAPAAAQGLADLLADVPGTASVTNGNGTNGAHAAAADDGSDSDDDFNPRGFESAPAAAAGGAAGGAIPTSRLVQNLAAARMSVAEEQARAEAAVTPLSAMQAAAATAENKAPAGAAYNGLVNFDNIMQDKSTRVESKPIASMQQTSTVSPTKNKLEVEAATAAANTAVEVDPFGDLLSTAKKSGVL